MRLDDIELLCDQSAVPNELRPQIRILQESHLLGPFELESWLKSNVPGSDVLIDAWRNTSLHSLTLTTVGIAIAHANIRRKTKREDYNLDVWIPE